MNNQLPNLNNQINSNIQILITKRNMFGKLVFGHWLLFGYCCLVIGIYSNSYALNLDKLNSLFLSGDYKAVIIEGEKILATNESPLDLDELYYILGLSYMRDGNLLRASDIFEIIINEYKNSSLKEDARLGLADTYFLMQNFNKAEGYCKEIINNDTRTKLKAEVYYRLSEIGFKKGDIKGGKEYLDKLKKEFPADEVLTINKDFYSLLQSAGSPEVYYTVQVGLFSKITNARNLLERLKQRGYAVYMEESNSEGRNSYRVKVGKATNRQEIVDLQNKLSKEGYPVKICP